MNYPYDYDEKTPYQLVREWMASFQREMDKEWNQDDGGLCADLIAEEATETLNEMREVYDFIASDGGENATAIWVKDKIESEKLTKELCDLIWVCYFCAAKFGLPIEEAFKRVYESNMSKLDDNGEPILRKDGKILKSDNYKPADLKDLFND